MSWDDDTAYAGDGTVAHTRTYEWNHGIGEIITAVSDAGLEVRMLREHRFLEWQGMPHMVLGGDGLWRMPADREDLVPLLYTLMAVKPGG